MNIGLNHLHHRGLHFPRVALVKQDVHNDLYYRASPAGSSDIVYSSILRTGPVGLFTALNADFIVVRADDSPECESWKQKASDCRHHDEGYYRSFQGEVTAHGRRFDHREGAKSVDDIDWGSYGLVISIDIAIPTRIVRSHKSTIWAYYVSEPCMGLYRESLAGPQFGYDFFFTLWPFDASSSRPFGVLDFPYFLQYVGCFQDLDGAPNPPFENRRHVSLERHTGRSLDEQSLDRIGRLGRAVWKHGGIRDLVNNLRQSRFHLRLEGKLLWGNSLIEAAALGAIVLASPVGLKHRMALKENWCRTLDDAVERMIQISNDDELRWRLQVAQAEMIDERCFAKPLRSLADAMGQVAK